MKKICFSLAIIIAASALPHADASEIKPCRKGEVQYEGGAIVCPLCKDAGADYKSDPKYSAEVNEHMKKALNDELDSAKWLTAYFSQPAHKDYAEAKKWFGRALGIGADGKDLKLPGGYDEPYMTLTSLKLDGAKLQIITSCAGVGKNWKPQCYLQVFNFQQEGQTTIEKVTIINRNYDKHDSLISRIKSFNLNGVSYMALETKNMTKNQLERVDYLKGGRYLGSSMLVLNDGISLSELFASSAENHFNNGAAKPLPEEIDLKALAAVGCLEYEVGIYPAAARDKDYNFKEF